MRLTTSILAFLVIGLTAVALTGCGGGSAEAPTSTASAEAEDAPGSATTARAAEGESRQARRQVTKSEHKPSQSTPKDPKAKHSGAPREKRNRDPSQPRRAPSAHPNLPPVVEAVVGEGGGDVKRTASSPQEIHEVLEEVEHPADAGSSPESVKSIVNQIVNP
jgi:hypothetical protein